MILKLLFNNIKRTTFIRAINDLKIQIHKDIENAERLAKVYPEASSAHTMYDNSKLSNALLLVLKEAMCEGK